MQTVNTKRFGQFLHERGMINGTQLLHVLEQQKATPRTLGEAAIDSGMLSSSAVASIRNEQLRRDVDFGPAAVSLGLISEKQVADLHARVHSNPARLSQSLIENGYVDSADLARAELAYAEDGMVRTLRLMLTLEQTRNPRIAEASASVLPRLYERVMGSPLQVSVSGATLPSTGGSRVWSQALHVEGETFTLAMQMRDADALSLAQVVLGLEVDDFDELAEDAVSEFLNIVTGHICGNLAVSGAVRVDPPQVDSRGDFSPGPFETVVLECDGEEITFHFALP